MDEPDRSSRPRPEADDQPPPESHASIQVEVFDALELLGESARRTLVELATRALALLPNSGQVRVCIVNDQRMCLDHEKFSGIATTTDVLTFDLSSEADSFDQKKLDVDLTICFDQAKRQASQLGHRVEQELLLYIIHGTLHCLGYDDHTQTDYQRMHEKEDELLARIGIEPTFFSESCSPKDQSTQKEHYP